MSEFMGYSKQDIESVPEGANMGLGCGNPVAIGSLKAGETVVDLGSGGGFDSFLAAKEVGETGKVIGVDMTPDMISKSRRNAEKIGTKHVEFRLGEIENLPVADNSVDIIMSNCVINLSPEKLSVYREAYRVLKPGGRLAISDIVATAKLPDEVQKNLALVAACVGGAATIDDTVELLKEAGFQKIKIKPNDSSRELNREWDPSKSESAGDYVVSAYIEAVKPR
jgi:ubiquinone/menaquinone biosynthesis C-methylase UbiE